MICDRYDVVVVPFPFEDIPVLKRRPVVVISGRKFNAENGHSVVAMITTAKQTNWPSDIAISDLNAAGLRQPCIARLRFQTMPNDLLQSHLGSFGGMDRLNCERQLAEMFL